MARPELKPGTQIEKYRVLRRIGEGGMATIYRATSVGPGGFEKPCALKLLKPAFSDAAGVTDLLIREARVAALLHHPNIIQVFDLGRHDSGYYMTMEWVDGVSLSTLLRALSTDDRRLPVGLAAFVGLSVAGALGYLKRGVEIQQQLVSLVHRDVTPSNVLISTEGLVKLTDFGIVKLLETPTETKVGVVKGKYAYMSPEQIRGDAVDHRSDIFALGVILFESLTGRRLFNRPTLAATVAAVHAAKVLPPSVFNESVPPELDRMVLKALARDRDDRFQDAEEVARCLEKWVTPGAQRSLGQLAETFRDQQAGRSPSALSLPSHRQLSVEDDHTDELPDVGREEFAELESLVSQQAVRLTTFDDGAVGEAISGVGSTGSFISSARPLPGDRYAGGSVSGRNLSSSAARSLDLPPMPPLPESAGRERTNADSVPVLAMNAISEGGAWSSFTPALPIVFFVLSMLATLALWIVYD